MLVKIHAKLNSFKADCMIVSFTAQNTSLIFSVSLKTSKAACKINKINKSVSWERFR